MTDKMKVYSKVKQALKKMLPTANQNQVVVLAMMVTGIVMGGKAQLSEMSLHVPEKALPDSLAKRFQRFVKNDHVVSTTLFLPFAQQIIAALAGSRLVVMMDASQVARGCMTLMVAVVYRNRALPLAWIVYKGKKGHTTADRHIAVLQLLQEIVPPDAEVVLLGDAEYDTVEMLEWVTAHTNWFFVVRTSPRILLTEQGRTYPFSDLLHGQHGCVVVTDVLFTKQTFGPVMAIATWQPDYERPLYLVTNHDRLQNACTFYQLRFKVETLFSDTKSRGFNIQKSHLSDPKRIARLLLAAVLAYIWMVFLGVETADDESRRRQVDRSNRTDKSLFRLGFDWLKHSLTRGLDFNVLFSPPSHITSLCVR